LINDHRLADEFVSKLLQFLPVRVSIDSLGSLEVQPQGQVGVIRLDKLDQLMDYLEDLVLIDLRQFDLWLIVVFFALVFEFRR
jgi:hypothetical protein